MQKLNTQTIVPYVKTVSKWLVNHKKTVTWEELKQCYTDLITNCSNSHQLHFATPFSQLSFIIDNYSVDYKMSWQCHRLRILFRSEGVLSDEIQDKAMHVIQNLISIICQEPLLYKKEDLFLYKRENSDSDGEFIKFISGVALEFKEKDLIVQLDYKSQEKYTLSSDQLNEHVVETIKMLKEHKMLPCEINLEQVRIEKGGTITTKFIILQPNFLIDVSGIASCVENVGYDKEKYVLNKLLPRPVNSAILLGNVVNLMFDEITFNDKLEYKEFTKTLFELFPLQLSLFGNQDLKKFLTQLYYQYKTLKHTYLKQAREEGLNSEYCYVEPSFISPEYGIQGRLDAIFINPNPIISNKIIELKSGKVFRPNKYGLNPNHYAQTLLYELLTKKALSKYRNQTANYILYSKADDFPLRYAPSTKNMFDDLMQLRNYLIAYEFQNLTVKGWIKTIRGFYSNEKSMLKGFLADNYNLVKTTFKNLRSFEKDYLLEQLAFLTREQMVQKIGRSGQRAGQSHLWNASLDEKKENFSILNHLLIEEVLTKGDPPIIRLKKSKLTSKLASFRVGDIVLLYPIVENEGISSAQVFKGTITDLQKQSITLNLRAKQRNELAFKVKYWNIEADYLDNSITRNMSNLMHFLGESIEQRDILLQPHLTLKAKEKEIIADFPDFFGTKEQIGILQQYIRSEKLFILWGPPGTGKTSVMLSQMVKYYFENTDEQLLLAGYTNRSVDEICEAILPFLNTEKDIIRIGSRHSTGAKHKNLLLQEQVKKNNNRAKLQHLIDNARVVVGTISSLSGKAELFQLKSFDRLIVDEASQILEPQIMTLYTKVKHMTLIGDHNQLPAVVSQDPKLCKYESDQLHELAFHDLSESLFGRIFRQLKEAKMHSNYAMLSYQGRMHQEINSFVSSEFYGGKLSILPSDIPISLRQSKKLNRSTEALKTELEKALNTERLIFIDSQETEEFLLTKSSFKEAQIVHSILNNLLEIDSKLDTSEIGIITPFKAQIAAIRQETEENLLLSTIKTDTVERYQGGAKDIIILSLTVNSETGLKNIINTNKEGVDRKLNVAISRAREQLIIVGNGKVLRKNESYNRLLKACLEINIEA